MAPGLGMCTAGRVVADCGDTAPIAERVLVHLASAGESLLQPCLAPPLSTDPVGLAYGENADFMGRAVQ